MGAAIDRGWLPVASEYDFCLVAILLFESLTPPPFIRPKISRFLFSVKINPIPINIINQP
jgi:hypothetical protein